MAVKTPSFGRVLHSWSPLNDKSVGGGDQTNGHDVFRVKLAHMDSSDGDITDNDREDSKDLLIEHRPRNGTGQGPCTLNTSVKITLSFIPHTQNRSHCHEKW